MLRPETAGQNTLTGVLQLLMRSRSTGVCEVSVLETGSIVGGSLVDLWVNLDGASPL